MLPHLASVIGWGVKSLARTGVVSGTVDSWQQSFCFKSKMAPTVAQASGTQFDKYQCSCRSVLRLCSRSAACAMAAAVCREVAGRTGMRCGAAYRAAAGVSPLAYDARISSGSWRLRRWLGLLLAVFIVSDFAAGAQCTRQPGDAGCRRPSKIHGSRQLHGAGRRLRNGAIRGHAGPVMAVKRVHQAAAQGRRLAGDGRAVAQAQVDLGP